MEFSQLLAAATVEVGQYINIWKCLPIIIILLICARLLTWMDKDSIEAQLPRFALNAAFLIGLIAAFTLFLVVHGFMLALALFLFFFVAEFATYLIMRRQKIGL